MGRHGSMTVRAAMTVSTGVTVAGALCGAAVLLVLQLHRGQDRAEQRRVSAIAETYAAQVVEWVDASQHLEVGAFIDRVRWHPTTLLIAVLDARQDPVASRGDDSILARYLARPLASRPSVQPQAWSVPADPTHPRPPGSLVAVPLTLPGSEHPVGTLLYAAQLPDRTSGIFRQLVVGCLGLALVGLCSAALGVRWLRGRVLAPLARLTERARQARLDHSRVDLPTDRRDEIGEVARLLVDLNMDVEEWRGRTTELKVNLSRRVDYQTARIAKELSQVQRKAWTDPLTRLGNRRLLEDRIGPLLAKQRKAGAEMAVVMFDVDNFKTLNDTLGHGAGDELLRFMGELLSQCVREEDLAIRLGGDEFLLVLPCVSARNAKAVADRVIRLFAQRAGLLPVQPKPTISGGVAELLLHRPDTAEALLHMADRALYEAKSGGKFTVAVYNAEHALVPVA